MPTLEQAKKIISVIKEKLPMGADNKPGEFPLRLVVKSRVLASRGIKKELLEKCLDQKNRESLKSVEKYLTKYQKSDPFLQHSEGVLDRICLALLAKTVKCGRCADQSAVGFSELLKMGSDGRIEHVKIRSRLTNDTHELLVLNRPLDVDIRYPEQLDKGVIIFDPWAEQLIEVSEKNQITKKLLASAGSLSGEDDDISIELLASHDGRLTADQCQMVIDFLEAIKDLTKLFGEELFQRYAKQHDWMDIHVSKETLNFIGYIDEEISFYSRKIIELEKAIFTQNVSEAKTVPFTSMQQSFIGLTGFYSKSKLPEPDRDVAKSDAEVQSKFLDIKICLGAFMINNSHKVSLVKTAGSADVNIAGKYRKPAFETLSRRLQNYNLCFDTLPNNVYTNLRIKNICQHKVDASKSVELKN